jgi:hypothetical protein
MKIFHREGEIDMKKMKSRWLIGRLTVKTLQELSLPVVAALGVLLSPSPAPATVVGSDQLSDTISYNGATYSLKESDELQPGPHQVSVEFGVPLVAGLSTTYNPDTIALTEHDATGAVVISDAVSLYAQTIGNNYILIFTLQWDTDQGIDPNLKVITQTPEVAGGNDLTTFFGLDPRYGSVIVTSDVDKVPEPPTLILLASGLLLYGLLHAWRRLHALR